MPEFAKTIDDMATDTAVKVVIDKEAIQRDTDVEINVSIKNKEAVKN
jgi:post-segregation antitoxin (ccd killing protein)